MGMKTIQRKQKEYKEKLALLQHFEAEVEKIDKAMATLERRVEKLNKAQEELYQLYGKVSRQVASIPTGGDRAFDQYKQQVIAYCEDPWASNEGPPKSRDLRSHVDRFRRDADAEHRRWMEGLEARWPREIKVGMVFRWYTTGDVWEVVSGPTHSTNPNLKGAERIWWKLRKEGTNTVVDFNEDKLSPKNKWKFLRT